MLQSETDQETLNFACELADAARVIACKHFRTPVPFENKSDGSPVTIADKSIESMMRRMIRERFPQDGIVGEEEESVSINSDRLWVLDPIDGTKSFMSGMPTFGTLIATVENGRPQLGVIDLPALGERWIGGPDRPTELNGEICQTRRCTQLSEAVLYSTSPDIFRPEELRRFEQASGKAAMRRFGGDCYAYALLSSGHIDAIIEAAMKPFDFMALVPVIEGAGGVISNWEGEPLSFDSNGQVLASATLELHKELLGELKKPSDA